MQLLRRPPVSRQLLTLVWAGLAIALFTGLVASALRAAYVTDLAGRTEPFRDVVLGVVGVAEPNAMRRSAAVARIDGKFAAHAVATLVHVGFGALLFILIPLQLSKRIRSRYRAAHRWLGRLFIVVASVTAAGGLFFGVLHPFAGIVEQLIIGVVGIWFLFTMSMAYVSIRRGRTAEHREWMLRTVAGALAISTVRMVVPPIDVVLTSWGVRPEVVFLNAFWMGWALTLLTAEWWIRRTRSVVLTEEFKGSES